jgi:hypothetical protein
MQALAIAAALEATMQLKSPGENALAMTGAGKPERMDYVDAVRVF